MKEIGNNLKRIRLLQNLSLEKAGELLHMSAPAVAKYEKGLITPNSEKLIEFADAYKVNVTDILKVYNTPNMKFASFRKKQRLQGQNLELLKEIIQNKVADYLEVIELNNTDAEMIKLKRFNCESIEDARNAADEFKKYYHLSLNQPMIDLINILENLGILVILIDNVDNKFSDFDGLSEVVNSIPIIVLLKDEDGARQRFTIAHELGHLVLNIKNEKLNEERMCNQFAGSLLMPKEAVLKEFGVSRNRISYYELTTFKKEYKASMAAIIYRLKDLSIISENLLKNLYITFNIVGIKKNEPIKIEPEQSYQFEKIVHKLETSNIISLNKACELLGISVNEYYNQDNNYGY